MSKRALHSKRKVDSTDTPNALHSPHPVHKLPTEPLLHNYRDITYIGGSKPTSTTNINRADTVCAVTLTEKSFQEGS
jgi:hypothetical protein